jgi:hypothetical protein
MAMTVYALASEYGRLTPTQQSAVTHIIADDGTWTPDQITAALNGGPLDRVRHEEDWTRQ